MPTFSSMFNFGRYYRPPKTSKIMNINDYLESSKERRTRRNKNIKTMFQTLVVEQNLSCMDAYEVVGWHFYLSAMEIRRIIATVNKKCSI